MVLPALDKDVLGAQFRGLHNLHTLYPHLNNVHSALSQEYQYIKSSLSHDHVEHIVSYIITQET